jgi:hypothetical protein
MFVHKQKFEGRLKEHVSELRLDVNTQQNDNFPELYKFFVL